jgi:hypothetical protein
MKTGLDDGPPLPAHVVTAWKTSKARELRATGLDLRTIAKRLDVSHETIRVWTAGGCVRRGARPKPLATPPQGLV